MGNYADKVDYYLNKGVGQSFIRTDKQRAFDKFDSINLDIDNIDITVKPTGDDVTVQFDKEWEFEGATRSEGKVETGIEDETIERCVADHERAGLQEYRK